MPQFLEPAIKLVLLIDSLCLKIGRDLLDPVLISKTRKTGIIWRLWFKSGRKTFNEGSHYV